MADLSKMTEDELLAHEAKVAQASIARLKSEITDTVKLAADPRAWAETYPIPSAITALAGGVVAGGAVRPMIFGKKHPSSSGTGPAHPASSGGKPGRIQSLMRPVVNMAKNSIKTALISAVTATAAVKSQDDDSSSDDPAAAADGVYASSRTSAQL